MEREKVAAIKHLVREAIENTPNLEEMQPFLPTVGEAIRELERGEQGLIEPPQPVSTIEIIDKFLAAKRAGGLSEASIQSYGDTLRVFAKYYPTLPTTPEQIEEYLSRFKPDKPTARDAFIVIRLLYKWGAERLGLPNPMTKLTKPRFRTKTPDRLTDTQAKALLDAIRTDRERALVYCFLGLGLRRSEAERLNIGDIGEDTILVHGKERVEPMPLIPEIREALLKVAGGREPNEAVFVGQRGRLTPDMLAYNIKQLFIRAGISGVKRSPHTLRHTRGALTAAKGLDSYSSRRLLRHANTTMTDLYSQLNLDELRAKEERFNPLRILANPQQTFRKNIH